jgi:RNA polymerase sigma-70 factor (ECF subfamily)
MVPSAAPDDDDEPEGRVLSERDYADLRKRLAFAVGRVCPDWMRDQEDDLVQMGVMRILRGDPTAELSFTYLHRVAHSVVVDEIRRRKRRNEVGLSPSLPDRVRTEAPGPDQVARGTQLGETVVACLADLVPDRRRAVTLSLQGHGITEIATLLQLERKQAENLVYRGMKDLREALSQRGLAP